MAEGASEEHGEAVASALMTGIRQGKLNQGLGVYEAIDIMNQMGLLDIKSVPAIESEGDTWAVYDGKGSTGYYCMTKMTETAIEKARKHGISIVFGYNHNDAGSFGSYTWMVHNADMVALTSNNSVPMCSPLGGMGNVISVPPLDAIGPSGEEPPVWMSTKLCEWYDADTAQAVLQGTTLKYDSVIDPDTGAIGNDLAPYASPIEGYGRVFDQTAFQHLHEPRVYMLNLWNELMTAIINPKGVIAPEVPSLTEIAAGEAEASSVGGSYMLVIDPSHFGPIEEVKAKSDRFARAIAGTKPLPGTRPPRMPGQEGYRSLTENQEDVQVLASHWAPFFNTQAGRHGMTEESLRAEWEAQR
jgi:LDH2 family malate/lactate/ureidoglycolate dehydrogenase